ncbi:uncharacterized protein LOC134841593 [Symsagittifera roscoffensis]|uniref:uncharacterized protein LOC134841593 n=1 Tax=Symsagittifera roscoffensis TaxID=84072 RepID=UPI00307C8BAD
MIIFVILLVICELIVSLNGQTLEITLVADTATRTSFTVLVTDTTSTITTFLTTGTSPDLKATDKGDPPTDSTQYADSGTENEFTFDALETGHCYEISSTTYSATTPPWPIFCTNFGLASFSKGIDNVVLERTLDETLEITKFEVLYESPSGEATETAEDASLQNIELNVNIMSRFDTFGTVTVDIGGVDHEMFAFGSFCKKPGTASVSYVPGSAQNTLVEVNSVSPNGNGFEQRLERSLLKPEEMRESADSRTRTKVVKKGMASRDVSPNLKKNEEEPESIRPLENLAKAASDWKLHRRHLTHKEGSEALRKLTERNPLLAASLRCDLNQGTLRFRVEQEIPEQRTKRNTSRKHTEETITPVQLKWNKQTRSHIAETRCFTGFNVIREFRHGKHDIGQAIREIGQTAS